MLNDDVRPIGIVRRGLLLGAGPPSLLLDAAVRGERLVYRAGLLALPVAGCAGAGAGIWWAWPDAGAALLAAFAGAFAGAAALCALFVLVVAATQLALGRPFRVALADACAAESAALIGTSPETIEIERHLSFRETAALAVSKDAGMAVQLGHMTGWHITLLPLDRVSEVVLRPLSPGERWFGGEAARVTLYWTDASGEPGATVAWFGRDDDAARRIHAALCAAIPASRADRDGGYAR